MKRAAFLLGGAFAGLLSTALPAQDRADPARLDDFAIPQGHAALPVEQLTTGDDTSPAPQAVDRTLARPPQSETSGAMPAQLASTGQGSKVDQLPSTRDSRLSATTAVSGTGDSAPGTVVRIGGQDKCDPQLTQRFYAECLRVLEQRSAEFNAPRPPELSAEQKLLVEQRQRETSYAENSPALRVRYASTTQPDADLQTNQELAAIYLRDTSPVPEALPPEETPDAKLGEVLQALGVETTLPPPGP